MAFTKADKVQFRANSLPFGTDWIPGINGYRAAQNPKARAAMIAAYDREIEEITWELAEDMGFADDLQRLYELEAEDKAELEAVFEAKADPEPEGN